MLSVLPQHNVSKDCFGSSIKVVHDPNNYECNKLEPSGMCNYIFLPGRFVTVRVIRLMCHFALTFTAKAINPLRHHRDCSINGASNSLVQNGKCLNRTRFGRQRLQIDARCTCPIGELRARPATRIGHSYPISRYAD